MGFLRALQGLLGAFMGYDIGMTDTVDFSETSPGAKLAQDNPVTDAEAFAIAEGMSDEVAAFVISERTRSGAV